MIRRKFFLASMVLATFSFFVSNVLAQKTPQAKEVGGKFLCMCGCNQVLTQCNHVGCTVSTSMLKQVDQAVAQGDSEEKITQDFVKEFGSTVYAEPPKSGISLVAWLMPTVYLVLGSALVVFVITRWRKVAVSAVSATGTRQSSHFSQELLDKARSRAARETED